MTPEQEEQVRRALRAAARADEPVPMPPEVASRLDAVLADLAGRPEEQGAEGGRATDELASRRNRRWPNRRWPNRRWPNLLVAAAAVAVIAVAGGAVATDGFGTLGGGGDVATSNAKSAAGSQQNDTAPSASGTRGLTGEAAKPGVPRLSSTTLTSDVQRLLRAPHSFTGGSVRAPRSTGKAAVQCARPFTGRGSTLFVVRLDGRAATLVVGPARDGRRQARIYSCDGAGSPLASVSVPAR